MNKKLLVFVLVSIYAQVYSALLPASFSRPIIDCCCANKAKTQFFSDQMCNTYCSTRGGRIQCIEYMQ